MLPELLHNYVKTIKEKVEQNDPSTIEQIKKSAPIESRKTVRLNRRDSYYSDLQKTDQDKVEIRFGGTDVKKPDLIISNVSGSGKYKIVNNDGIYTEVENKEIEKTENVKDSSDVETPSS